MFHIVDVDNTLVFTNQLNTAGYVYYRPRIRIHHIP